MNDKLQKRLIGVILREPFKALLSYRTTLFASSGYGGTNFAKTAYNLGKTIAGSVSQRIIEKTSGRNITELSGEASSLNST